MSDNSSPNIIIVIAMTRRAAARLFAPTHLTGPSFGSERDLILSVQTQLPVLLQILQQSHYYSKYKQQQL